MASENDETIADILRVMRDARNLDPSAIEDNNHLLSDWYYDDECKGWLSSFADRIEAAHKREVAELKRELEATRQQRNRARLDAQEKFVREVAELRDVGKQMLRRWCSMSCTCEHCEFKAEPCARWRKALEGVTK